MVQRVDALVDITDGGLSPVPAWNGVTFESILNVSQSANVCYDPYRTSIGATHLVISLTGLDLALLALNLGMTLLELTQDFLS